MKKINFNIVLAAIIGLMVGSIVQIYLDKRNAEQSVDPASWQKLNAILDFVDKNYVDEIDRDALTEAAVEAALKKLDPHSLYLPPKEYTIANADLSDNFEGVGIQFNVPSDTAIVLMTIPGGPSQKLGILPGDRIVRVDSKTIAGVKMPQDSMVTLMRGPAGTKVVLSICRDGEYTDFEIIRAKIPLNSVDSYYMMNDTTGYVKLSKFSTSTYKEVVSAVGELQKKGMKKLVFDLRGNTGGYFDQALRLSAEFLKKKSNIVYIEGRARERQDFKSDRDGRFCNLKLIVLIDDGSASSSEIFAGAIQDNDAGIIVGRRSFGKGLVQEPLDFTDGSGVRITVSRFHTPSGRCIQKPYTDDYSYDFINRYNSGELVSADSIKVDTSKTYKTIGGRTVYGGGGIIPDVFVPIDTSKVGPFYLACNKKSTTLRYSSLVFDRHKDELLKISDYDELAAFFEKCSLEKGFLEYARTKDDLVPQKGEWERTREYMLPSLKGLVGRYSLVGENAFYYYYMDIDPVIIKALEL